MAFNWFRKKSKNEEKPVKLDYEAIDSNEKAVALYEKKELVKLYLMPLEFGGADSPLNTLYVPPVIQELKQRFDDMIEKDLRQGKKMSYSATPAYKGKSFIPSSLEIAVTGEVNFTEVIHIW